MGPQRLAVCALLQPMLQRQAEWGRRHGQALNAASKPAGAAGAPAHLTKGPCQRWACHVRGRGAPVPCAARQTRWPPTSAGSPRRSAWPTR